MTRLPRQSVLPGVSTSARRPGVLVLVPAWTLTLALLILPPLVAYVARCVDPKYQGASITLVGIVVSSTIIVMSWEVQHRHSNYQRMMQSVAGIITAWECMKHASGIGRALEQNIIESRKPEAKKILGSARSESIEEVRQSVRDIESPLSVTTLGRLSALRKERYKDIKRFNMCIVKQWVSKKDGTHADSLDLPLIDEAAVERLVKASAEWDQAVALLRASVARWPVLDDITNRADILVQRWWTYAKNDPYYRNKDLTRQRDHAFHDASDYIELFRHSMATRRIGHRTWRYLLLRITVGASVMFTIDQQNDLVR